ncbi:MAG: GNAT family N-acetyltransferase [Candidatus Promineifilaceae bacterium]
MIDLVPMTAEEYEVYLDTLVPDYAQEHVNAGNWPAEGAEDRARKEMREIYLPDGVATQDNYLFALIDPEIDTKVGILWYAIRGTGKNREAFVYDVVVYEPFRRQGYGYQAFQKMEEKVREIGVNVIGLHVFGYNHGARAMYEKLGFEVTDLMMRKWL